MVCEPTQHFIYMHSIKHWNLILNGFWKILQENAIGELEVVLIIIEKIHKSNKLVRHQKYVSLHSEKDKREWGWEEWREARRETASVLSHDARLPLLCRSGRNECSTSHSAASHVLHCAASAWLRNIFASSTAALLQVQWRFERSGIGLRSCTGAHNFGQKRAGCLKRP